MYYIIIYDTKDIITKCRNCNSIVLLHVTAIKRQWMMRVHLPILLLYARSVQMFIRNKKLRWSTYLLLVQNL